jgi:5-methyltetrahydrofolate--homocysteine methyltransferase
MKDSPPHSPRGGDEHDNGLGVQLADPCTYNLLKQFVKENRQNETPAEMVLWKFLRGDQLGVHFRRQHIIGDYIADFVCLPLRLIIELDGGYHHLPSQQRSDVERTEWLKSKGFKVIRFSNEEVLGGIESTINKIKRHII